MKRVPDMVNLPEFVDPSDERPKADKPIRASQKIRRERLNIRPGEVRLWNDEQRPKYEEKVVRKKTCPFCGHHFRKLRAICPRCKNCQACGSYNGNQRDRICKTCGNYDSGKPDNVPTIIVN